jgi:hypothetical protein
MRGSRAGRFLRGSDGSEKRETERGQKEEGKGM